MQSNSMHLFDKSEGKTGYWGSMSLEKNVDIMLLGFFFIVIFYTGEWHWPCFSREMFNSWIQTDLDINQIYWFFILDLIILGSP